MTDEDITALLAVDYEPDYDEFFEVNYFNYENIQEV